MPHQICPGCNRSIEPLERLEKDKKGHTWKITYCQYDRCKFNIEIEEVNIKSWNASIKNHYYD